MKDQHLKTINKLLCNEITIKNMITLISNMSDQEIENFSINLAKAAEKKDKSHKNENI